MHMGKFLELFSRRLYSHEPYSEAKQRQLYDILNLDVIFPFQILRQKMVLNHKT